jgi:2-oxoglutarate dehydrogenase complex dehydrogenase (E1) component-like enzyme
VQPERRPRAGRRGTFSQWHAELVDLKTGERIIPLNDFGPEQAEFCVYNSLLSEGAMLGFDSGYSLDEPHMLIMWEAQFGDFADGAQVIVDQLTLKEGVRTDRLGRWDPKGRRPRLPQGGAWHR